MRLKPGDIIVAGDRDFGEEYLAETVECRKDTDDRNPVVRVRRCLRYPMQTAIADRTVVMERRPVEDGALVRLRALRMPTEYELRGGCDDGPAAAIRAMAAETENEEIHEILCRHLRGEFRCRPRLLDRYNDYDWEMRKDAYRELCE